MRAPRFTLLALAVVTLLVSLTGCAATGLVPVSSDASLTEAPEVPTEEGTSSVLVFSEQIAGVALRVTTEEMEVTADEGRIVELFELGDGERYHAASIRPGASAELVEVVLVTMRGQHPSLHLLAVAEDRIDFMPVADTPQPVSGRAPVLGWTPDAASLVWVDGGGEGAVLRAIGWDDEGPAWEQVPLPLGLEQDVHLDGFEEHDDGSWTLLLRPDAGGDPIELGVERNGDAGLGLTS